MGAKIRRAQLDKIPIMAIIGKREATSKQVSVRSRLNGDEGASDINDFIDRVKAEASFSKVAAQPF